MMIGAGEMTRNTALDWRSIMRGGVLKSMETIGIMTMMMTQMTDINLLFVKREYREWSKGSAPLMITNKGQLQ